MDLREYIDYQHKFYQACEVADAYLEAALSGSLDTMHSQHFMYRALKCDYCKQKAQEAGGVEKLQERYVRWARKRMDYIMEGFDNKDGKLKEVFDKEIIAFYTNNGSDRKKEVAKYLQSLDLNTKRMFLGGLFCEMLDVICHLQITNKVIKRDEYKSKCIDIIDKTLAMCLSLQDVSVMTRNCPVNTINCLYYVKNAASRWLANDWDALASIDKVISKARSVLIQMASEIDEDTTDVQMQNILYGLTHVVIGASAFYMKPAMNVQLEANIIADWLQKGMNSRNASWLTNDLMCECAVVLKYVGIRPDIVHKAYARMVTKVKKGELLPASKECEHTAALFVIASPLYK